MSSTPESHAQPASPISPKVATPCDQKEEDDNDDEEEYYENDEDMTIDKIMITKGYDVTQGQQQLHPLNHGGDRIPRQGMHSPDGRAEPSERSGPPFLETSGPILKYDGFM